MVFFTHFRGQLLASQLSLKHFTVKLKFFLSLLSGQRSQTIKSLTTVNVELSTDECVFNVADKMKQTRVGTHVAPLVFLSYSADEKLCSLTHLKEYIKRTSHLRNGIKQLLLSHSKPHCPVSTDTISRWVKQSYLLLALMCLNSKATAPEQRQLFFLLLTISASKK